MAARLAPLHALESEVLNRLPVDHREEPDSIDEALFAERLARRRAATPFARGPKRHRGEDRADRSARVLIHRVGGASTRALARAASFAASTRARPQRAIAVPLREHARLAAIASELCERMLSSRESVLCAEDAASLLDAAADVAEWVRLVSPPVDDPDNLPPHRPADASEKTIATLELACTTAAARLAERPPTRIDEAASLRSTLDHLFVVALLAMPGVAADAFDQRDDDHDDAPRAAQTDAALDAALDEWQSATVREAIDRTTDVDHDLRFVERARALAPSLARRIAERLAQPGADSLLDRRARLACDALCVCRARRRRLALRSVDDARGARALDADARERALLLVQRAESDEGLRAFNHLLLSCSLPQGVVRHRRRITLSRHVMRYATAAHLDVVERAYRCANVSPEIVWLNAHDVYTPCERACALLSGLCVALDARDSEDAFAGRVELPFLQTTCADESATRLHYSASTDVWTLYSRGRAHRRAVEVLTRGEGIDALVAGVLGLLASTA